jgi:hypothetical protein
MTLDASGNLGIGTTSPGTRLEVNVSGANGINLATAGSLDSPRLFFTGSGGAGTSCVINNANGDLRFATGGTAGSSSGTERARIDSSGNLLVGTTSSGSGKIVVNNTPTSQWGIDFAQSTVTVANNSNATIPAGSGIIILTDGSQTGCTGMYIVGGGGVALVSGTTSGGGTTLFVTPTTTPAAGKACVAYDGANYRIYNNQGNSIGFTVAMLRSRNSN